MKSAGKTFGRGFAWFLGARLIGVTVSLVTVAVLARLLTPADFGVAAIVSSVIALSSVVLEGLIVQTIIQRHQSSREFVAAIAAVGLVVAAALCAFQALVLSWLLAGTLGMPALESMLMVSTVFVLVKALSSPLMAVMQTEHRFATISGVLVVSNLLGYAIPAIALAGNGFGAWAIVLGSILAAILELVFLWALSQNAALPRLNYAVAKPALEFGAYAAASRTTAWGATNVDTYIVAIVLGPTALGFYSRSYNLFVQVKELFDMPMRRTLQPVLAGMQQDVSRVAASTRSVLSFVQLGTVLIAIFVYIAAPEIVRILLGGAWGGVVPVLQLLFMGLPARIGTLVIESTFVALGYGQSLFLRQVFHLVVIASGCWFGSYFGIEGVGAGVAIAYWTTYTLFAAGLMLRLKIGFVDFVQVHALGLFAGVTMFIALMGLSIALDGQGPVLRFVLLGACWGGLVMAAGILVPDTWLGEQAARFRSQGLGVLRKAFVRR